MQHMNLKTNMMKKKKQQFQLEPCCTLLSVVSVCTFAVLIPKFLFEVLHIFPIFYLAYIFRLIPFDHKADICSKLGYIHMSQN